MLLQDIARTDEARWFPVGAALRITGKGRLCEAEFWCFFRFQFFCGGEIKNGAQICQCALIFLKLSFGVELAEVYALRSIIVMSSAEKTGNAEKIRKDGVSLRLLYIWLIVIAVSVSALMIFSTAQLSTTFQNLSDAVEKHMELSRATDELMDASDYLTENVQRFSVTGDVTYMDNYFHEATVGNRREKAIEVMSDQPNSADALQSMKSAFTASRELMLQEYYSMKLVVDAEGMTDYPKILDTVELKDEDRNLSALEKRRRAIEVLFNKEYYSKKEQIRHNMTKSLEEVEKITQDAETSLARKHIFELDAVRLVIMIETVCIIFIILLTSYLGIKPIINAAERIKNDSPIPISGSNEFRYLARNYNKLYGAYRKSVAHLNYKASHDELTGAYNRTGYDLLFTSIDLKTTYMLLIDVDNFKDINDTYGHETGDKVLKKIVAVLNKNFRSDDYVCRLGGDEFVVFMVHADEHLHELVASKICQINKQLGDTSDSLPRTSVSVGVVHGTQVNNREDLYKYADESLYDIKRKGKNGFAFYGAAA